MALRHGIDIGGYRGRQVSAADFTRYTHIVAMDLENLARLKAMRPTHARAKLSLLLDHVDGREGSPVADPYFGDESGFDVTWSDVSLGAAALATKLAARNTQR